ncbi:MAG TPA: hypothetical protein K8V84_05425 [Nocardiopsis listeri]|uniref:hypothetical protein n=1 Tax=Nocardiopsis listeri TaxID=53440 RepID=UPI001E019FE9|nr:hypothetical protein [Nocardiopsis listeri]HJE57943.1 hypothetical protein [Nocardiopsis listeri]
MTKRGIDGGSLVAGVLFLGLAVVFVVQGSGSWDFNALWLLPVLFAGLGLAGVARALLRSRPDPSGAPRVQDSTKASED